MKSEQDQREFDNGMKVKAENDKAAASVMPAFEQILKALTGTLERMEATQQEMLAEMKKPKAVSIDSIQKKGDQITGARVAVH
jgi:hypothetical protein